MELYDEKGKAICQICGEAFNFIASPHFLKKHNMTTAEYRKQYPDSPIASHSFKAKQKKHSKANLFIPKEEVEIEKEFYLDNKDPLVKKHKKFTKRIKTPKCDIIKEYPNKNNSIHQDKIKILNLLLQFFQDVQDSYYIMKYSLSGFLDYTLITDICIPSMKIDIEFPETFWHNQDRPKVVRDLTLKQDGWKIIDILGKNPSLEEIENIIKTKILNKK